MVIGEPRSGTTWAANWLTTDTTLCLHDPLFNHHYSDLDSIRSKKMLGISCTGIAKFPHYLNAHPARKVILHRDPEEIKQSLEGIGLKYSPVDLKSICGMHVKWTDLFENPKGIYEYLLQRKFDRERHNELKQIEMQPDFKSLTINKEVTKRLLNEMMEAMNV